jgi:hypothetical protein
MFFVSNLRENLENKYRGMKPQLLRLILEPERAGVGLKSTEICMHQDGFLVEAAGIFGLPPLIVS